MKYTWTEKDVICGRIVCKPVQEGRQFEANGWTAKWTYKIGFRADQPSEQHHILIAMTDGMVGAPKTKAEVVAWLNENEMVPMPHKWWMQVVEWLRDCYEGH